MEARGKPARAAAFGFFFWHASVNATVVFLLPVLLILAGWYGGVPIRLRWLMGRCPRSPSSSHCFYSPTT
jgi:hypothetical protein